MKENKFVWLSIFVICILLIASIWFVALLIPPETVIDNADRSAVKEYSEGWECSVGNDRLVNVSSKTVVSAEQGEVVKLVNTLPSYNYDAPTLLFRTYQQNVRVYVDGEQVYSFGDFKVKTFIQTLPVRWNMATLPDDSSGKEIVIEIFSEYEKYSGYIPLFLIGPESGCYSYIIESGMPGLLLSFALIVIVAMLLIAILLSNKRSSGFKMLVWWGVTVLLAGVWSIATLGMIQLFFSAPYFEWLMRNTAAIFIVPSLLRVIYEYYDDEKTRRLAEIVFRLDLIFILLSLIVQIAGLVDLSLLMAIPIVFASFAVLVFIYGAVMTRKTDTLFTRVTNTVAAVALTAIVVLVPYMYSSRVGSGFDLFIRMLFVFISLVWTFMIIKNVLNRMKKYEQMKKTVEEKQMTMMVHQIKPHFIYNTLGAVRAMISEDPQKASEMLYDFSKYLRAHVDTLSVDKPISVEEELRNVKNYAKIERARFGDKIQVVYETEDVSFLIPPLTIQPLVENAITHGLRKKKDGGTVIIRTYSTKRSHIVEVVDNGAGFDTSRFEAKEKKPIRFIDLFRKNKEEAQPDKEAEDYSSGIKNIEFRLSAMLGGTLEIKSREGEGTVSRIVLPKRKNENNNG